MEISEEQFEKLVKQAKQLGSLNISRGVIRDEALADLGEAELIRTLKSQAVTHAKVFKTGTIILTFGQPTAPEKLWAGFYWVKVKAFIPLPLRCFKCQSDHFPVILSTASSEEDAAMGRWNLKKANWDLFSASCRSRLTEEAVMSSEDPASTFTNILIEVANDAIPKTSTFAKVHCTAEGKKAARLHPFLVGETLRSCTGRPDASRLRSGDLLVECRRKAHSNSQLQLQKIGDYPVTVSPHRSLNSSRGVIRDEALADLGEAELIRTLKSQAVTHAKVFKTGTIILTFGQPTAPEKLWAGFYWVKVKAFIPLPLRCFKCQRFGHGQASCRNDPTCAKCGGKDHDDKDCGSSPACINCKGSHPSFSKDCPKWKEECTIQRIRVEQKVSFPEARRIADHFPVILSTASSEEDATVGRWNLKKANWDLFSASCRSRLTEEAVMSSEDPASTFTNILIEVANDAIPKTSTFAKDCQEQEMGVPQGSILSPVLFSLKINNIVKSVTKGTDASLFVDDFALCVKGRSLHRAAGVDINSVEESLFPATPPWTLPTPEVRLDLTIYKKAETPDPVYFQGLQQILADFPGFRRIFTDGKFKNCRITRWALALQEFRFRIEPVQGKLNVFADCLSRSGSDQLVV
nr:hypothetical protein BaRGS_022861 [Batillaria attramentaria]